MRLTDLCTLVVASLVGSVAPRDALSQRAPNATTDRARPITYVKRGAPVRRTSAGVRGFDETALDRQRVVLVAPHDHVPWSVRTRPTLYWRFTGERGGIANIVFRLTRGARTDSVSVTGPLDDAPLQRIDLATLGLTLHRDVDYRWSVVVHYTDPALGAPSDEAWIRVVGANTLGTEPNDQLELARAAAAVGLWYDAFDTLTEAVHKSPSDDSLGVSWSSFVTSTVKGLSPTTLSPSGRTP